MTRHQLQLLSAGVLATLAISACGSSGNSSSRSATTVTVTHTITAPTSTATSTTRTSPVSTHTTTTASTPTGTAACNASTLTPVQLGSNGAAGTIVYGFALRNTGARTCHTYGYPGVSFLSASGQMLATDVKRTTRDVVGSVSPTLINVAPGSEASFRISIEDAYKGGALCRNARYLQIYAPDDTVAMRLTLSSGAEACGWGRVTALQPGDAAFAGQ